MSVDLAKLAELITEYKSTLISLEDEYSRLTRLQNFNIPDTLKSHWRRLYDIQLITKDIPEVDGYEYHEYAYSELTIIVTLKDRSSQTFRAQSKKYALVKDDNKLVILNGTYETVTMLWNDAKNISADIGSAIAITLYYLYNLYRNKLPWDMKRILKELKIEDR